MGDLKRATVLARLRGALASLGLARADVVALVILGLGSLVGLVALVWAQRAPSDAVVPVEPTLLSGTPAAAGDQGSSPGADVSPSTAGGSAPPVGAGGRVGPATGGAAAVAPVVVHVAGLVRNPGVLELPAGSRVADAVEAAGGALPEAWLDAVNLARPVGDGEQLLIPPRPPPGEPQVPPVPAEGPASGAAGGGVRPDGKVDLNRASAEELETLPGIGPVMAGRIVEHRSANGPFTEVGQLREVPGIGEKTFQTLAPLVTV